MQRVTVAETFWPENLTNWLFKVKCVSPCSNRSTKTVQLTYYIKKCRHRYFYTLNIIFVMELNRRKETPSISVIEFSHGLCKNRGCHCHVPQKMTSATPLLGTWGSHPQSSDSYSFLLLLFHELNKTFLLVII